MTCLCSGLAVGWQGCQAVLQADMLIRHSLFYLLSRLVSVGVTFISLWLFSRLVAPDDFGFYVTVMGLATLANIGLFQWLRITVLRLAADHASPREVQQTGWALLLLIMLLTAPLLLLELVLASTSWHGVAAGALGVSWAMAGAEYALELLRGALRPRAYLLFSMLRDVLLLALALLLFSYLPPAYALVLAQMGASLIPLVLWLPQLGWPRPCLNRQLITQMLHYGLPLLGLYLLGSLLANTDRLLLPWLAGAADTGLYGAASGIARQSLFALLQAVNLAAFPLALMAHRAGDQAQLKQQLLHNITLLLLLGVPSATGLMVLAPAISQTVLGHAYAGAAAHLLPLLALGTLLMSVRVFYTDHAFQLARDTRTPMRVLAGVCLLTLPLSAVLIHKAGLAGAIYTTLLGFALALGLSIYVGRTRLQLPWPRRDALVILLAALIMAGLLWPLRAAAGWAPLMLTIAFGSVIYASLILAFNVMNLRAELRGYLK